MHSSALEKAKRIHPPPVKSSALCFARSARHPQRTSVNENSMYTFNPRRDATSLHASPDRSSGSNPCCARPLRAHPRNPRPGSLAPRAVGRQAVTNDGASAPAPCAYAQLGAAPAAPPQRGDGEDWGRGVRRSCTDGGWRREQRGGENDGGAPAPAGAQGGSHDPPIT